MQGKGCPDCPSASRPPPRVSIAIHSAPCVVQLPLRMAVRFLEGSSQCSYRTDGILDDSKNTKKTRSTPCNPGEQKSLNCCVDSAVTELTGCRVGCNEAAVQG